MHVYYNINNGRIVHIFHKMHILTQIKKNVIPPYAKIWQMETKLFKKSIGGWIIFLHVNWFLKEWTDSQENDPFHFVLAQTNRQMYFNMNKLSLPEVNINRW